MSLTKELINKSVKQYLTSDIKIQLDQVKPTEAMNHDPIQPGQKSNLLVPVICEPVTY